MHAIQQDVPPASSVLFLLEESANLLITARIMWVLTLTAPHAILLIPLIQPLPFVKDVWLASIWLIMYHACPVHQLARLV